VALLERIKIAANKRDVPYQSLIKTWLGRKNGNTMTIEPRSLFACFIKS
jgi:hypothetical protein